MQNPVRIPDRWRREDRRLPARLETEPENSDKSNDFTAALEQGTFPPATTAARVGGTVKLHLHQP